MANHAMHTDTIIPVGMALSESAFMLTVQSASLAPSNNEAARIARINRRFNRIGNDLVLKRCRYESHAFHELGRVYVLNWRFKLIVDTFMDLDELEAELAEVGAES